MSYLKLETDMNML